MLYLPHTWQAQNLAVSKVCPYTYMYAHNYYDILLLILLLAARWMRMFTSGLAWTFAMFISLLLLFFSSLQHRSGLHHRCPASHQGWGQSSIYIVRTCNTIHISHNIYIMLLSLQNLVSEAQPYFQKLTHQHGTMHSILIIE